MAKPRITGPAQERLRELLNFNPSTGIFTWRKRRKCSIGTRAGYLAPNGYIYIGIDYERHLAHRLAWLVVTGDWPPQQIDHINGQRADNRFANLRLASAGLNSQNTRKPHTNNLAKLLGVSQHNYVRWQARIMIGGITKFLGSFDTPEEAHAAYLEAKRRLHEYNTL